MIFDTHAHYDDEQFDVDREEILGAMAGSGVGTVVNVSSDVSSWDKIRRLTEKYTFIYGAAGVHPDAVGELDEEKFQRLENIIQEDKIVAVGEIGLDYYWDNESRELQKKWFILQLQMARKHGLPVIIHSREAAADTLEIMQEYARGMKGVIHCFSYSKELAQEYVKIGFYLGIGGVVTFKNAKKLKDVVRQVPLESLVLETDCPYLAPVPNRGKRNSSLNLVYVAEEIAQLKEMVYEEVIRQTEENARELYQL
ncbi:TatD family hydrolase [Luxibacter massiliensis]|uniref:TatD family hydrolase n=1 Tax=Luxibacter massiliensis TaxID=2219695 RepID=UPI000F0639BA|nr:TatD family hydrolase [Luxibacter massiliensis]